MDMKAFTMLSMIILTGLVFVIIMTLPLWILWNWLVPSIFSLREINLVEAFGLLIMAKIMFSATVNNNKTDNK